MSEKEHTRGPWKYGPADDGLLYVYTEDGTAICQIGMAENVFANARLIAAAPDLLAACEAMEACDPYATDEEIERIAQQCRDAIAKAKGGAK